MGCRLCLWMAKRWLPRSQLTWRGRRFHRREYSSVDSAPRQACAWNEPRMCCALCLISSCLGPRRSARQWSAHRASGARCSTSYPKVAMRGSLPPAGGVAGLTADIKAADGVSASRLGSRRARMRRWRRLVAHGARAAPLAMRCHAVQHRTARLQAARRRGITAGGVARHNITRRSVAQHGITWRGVARAALQDRTPHGATSHGAAPHGAESQGETPHGATPHGAVLHGAASLGETPHGAAPHRTASRGVVSYGEAPHDTALHGAASHDAASHGETPHGATPHGAASHGAVSLGETPHGATPFGVASHSVAWHTIASHGAASHGAASRGAASARAQRVRASAPLGRLRGEMFQLHAPARVAFRTRTPAGGRGPRRRCPARTSTTVPARL